MHCSFLLLFTWTHVSTHAAHPVHWPAHALWLTLPLTLTLILILTLTLSPTLTLIFSLILELDMHKRKPAPCTSTGTGTGSRSFLVVGRTERQNSTKHRQCLLPMPPAKKPADVHAHGKEPRH